MRFINWPLTGVEERDLKVLLYSAVSPKKRGVNEYLIYGASIPQYMIRLRHPKICTACLREKSYVRRIWELAPVTTCPVHKCLLLDECPNCGKRISWTRPSVSYCTCDIDWRKYEATPLVDSELRVSRQIHLYCNLQLSKSAVGREITSNPLFNLKLNDFLSALFFVASQYAGLMDTKGKHLAPSMRSSKIHILLCNAWSVFENWPNNYFGFLDWRRTQVTSSESVRGLQRDFGEYKSALYKQLASSQLDFLRVAFEEYLIAHWDGGYTSHLKRLNEAARHNGKYVSRREAKELLKVGVKSMDNLIAVGQIEAIVRKQGNARLILIERDSLHMFKRELDQSLYLKQVQALLGISHKRVLELVHHGLLNPLRGPTVDGCSDWRFSKKEAQGLLDQINKKIIRPVSIANNSAMNFLMALRKLKRAHVGMVQFIESILKDEVSPCGISTKPGIASFQFSKKEISEYACGQLRAH